MENLSQFTLLTLFFYLLGSIPFGIIFCKIFNKGDPRKTISGNIGTTNVFRLAGTKIAILTLLFDIFKGIFPCWIIVKYYYLDWQIVIGCLSPFIGHCWPLYTKFKGGKGVATAIGIYISLSWPIIPLIMTIFIITLKYSKYVSLGSLLICPVSCLYFLLTSTNSNTTIILSTIIGIIIFFKHRKNIIRLKTQRENKIYFFSKIKHKKELAINIEE